MVRVLIVDDEQLIRNLLRTALELEGFEVTEAQNGREGVQFYRRTPVDVVITDIQMPEMDGLEMIKQMRRDDPDAKIIAITGNGMDSLATCEKLGVQSAFQKPFGMQEMLEAVRKLAWTL